jgi:secreted trypsin-like serine protease
MKHLLLSLILIAFASSAWAIHGGQNAREGELKSTVALATKNANGTYKTFCTGTLVNEHTLLTAAHCHGDSQAEESFVVFSLDLNSPQALALPVRAWKVHEKWDESTVDEMDPRNTHDLALATFEGDIPSSHEAALLLTDDGFVNRNTQIVVAGYGYQKESMEPGPSGWPEMPSGAGVLRSAKVKVADPKFSDTEVLTTEVKSGTTSADSGGSAFIRRGSKIYLWGVTSRGLPGEDGVYTRVSLFIDWIRQNL